MLGIKQLEQTKRQCQNLYFTNKHKTNSDNVNTNFKHNYSYKNN